MPFPQRVRILFGSVSPSKFGSIFPVLLIRDVYPGSRISNSNFFHPGSLIRIFSIRILDPGSASKNLSILTKKNGFLSSQKYDPSFPSQIRIRILTFYPSRIPVLDPRSGIQGPKRHRIPDTGSLIPDPGFGFTTLEISG
jgi:hypothetical protein